MFQTTKVILSLVSYVNWNDSNDVDWYEKFVTVLNSSFNKNTKIQDPSASLL